MLQLAKQPRSSMHTPLRSTTHFACSSLASCSRLRAAAPAVRSRSSTNSNSSAAAGQLDPAASLIWGLQPTLSPSVHAVIQYAFEPTYLVTHIVPPQLDLLHPDLLTNPPFTEFLAKHLLSRTAARESGAVKAVALVLSATYLSSQLDTMRRLAGKQSLAMSVFLSSDSSEMHTVFYRALTLRPVSIDDMRPTLADSLGPLEPLEPAQLQAVQAAEKRLQEELRLWDPATWSSVLQQRLESKKALDTWLLVDSLMGQVDLVAARQLVLKKGLLWLELSPEQLQTTNNTEVTSSRGRRSRKKSNNTTAAGPEPGEQQQGGDRAAVVISRRALTAEEVADACAELLGGAGGSSVSSAGQHGAFWLKFLTSRA